MPHLIAPSILSADFGHLARDVKMIHESEADCFHVDVMDGVYVPNISFGFPILKVIREHSDKYMDVHLMTSKPEDYIQEFRDAGADGLTVHLEVVTHLHSCLQRIKDAGMRAGVALNPSTPIAHAEEIIPYADLILIMSVNPGFGGQRFIESSLDKLRRMKSAIQAMNPAATLQVDGGVKLDNAADVLRAGADCLVSGSGIFGTEDPVKTIQAFKQIKANTLSV
jgi:ribulose-phosphate 3-epimerase